MRAILKPAVRSSPTTGSSAAAAALAVLLLASACSRADDPTGRTRVVASFYPLAEAARRVGGPCVDVVDLTPPGTEPHDLELAPDDVVAIAEADVLVYIGSGFQPAIEDAVAEGDGVVLDALDAVRTLPVPGSEDGGTADPHVWLDPMRYAQVTRAVADALSRAGVDPACDVRGRADALVAELEALDRDYREALATCERDVIVTAHAAFGYLADAYGLRQEAIAGIEPESQPSARRLSELRDLVLREGVTTILTEELVAPDVAETLAREAGVGTAVLRTIEGRTESEAADGLGYVAFMRENLTTLRDVLGCS
jgi:zinc transport system substrate-binding protein